MKKTIIGLLLFSTSLCGVAASINTPASVAYVNSKFETLLSLINAISPSPAPSLTIGQQEFGGIVFWLDSTGQHGLIVTSIDPGMLYPWGISKLTLARADGIGGGQSNTTLAIANQAVSPGDASNYAVVVCQQFAVQVDGQTPCTNPNDVCYADWYLPSKSELNQLYLQQNNIAGLGLLPSLYWSSTEVSASNAWQQNFSDGTQGWGVKSSGVNVRCIRSF